jgi:TolB protein
MVRDIFTIAPDGSNRLDLTNGSQGTYADQPDWSPDGTHLVYFFSDTYSPFWPGLFTMRADGSEQQRLTTLTGNFAQAPTWSPDGTKIAFQLNPGIWVVNADGAHAHRLTGVNTSTTDLYPAWQPLP